jgi:hypothetical protein
MSYGIAYDIGSWPEVAKTKPDYPVVGIRWADALAYAEWAGKRLATEAEWEKAASGTEGQLWPWGNQFNLDIGGVTAHANTWNGNDGYDNTTSTVDAYPTGVSPFGVHNMAGNVFEWCADWFDLDYYNRSPKMNPTGPETGYIRAIRGGSWRHDERLVRCAFRMGCHPDSKWYILGFRCVQEFDLNLADEGKALSGIFALDTRKLPPWDINRDEVVDIQDLMLLSKNFGKFGTEVLGDVNADGNVDVNDLVIVGRHLDEQ